MSILLRFRRHRWAALTTLGGVNAANDGMDRWPQWRACAHKRQNARFRVFCALCSRAAPRELNAKVPGRCERTKARFAAKKARGERIGPSTARELASCGGLCWTVPI